MLVSDSVSPAIATSLYSTSSAVHFDVFDEQAATRLAAMSAVMSVLRMLSRYRPAGGGLFQLGAPATPN